MVNTMKEYQDLDNPLKLEIEKRMQKNCDSGSFRITKGLIDLAGSVGAVLNAIYDRAAEINAEFTISVEKASVFRGWEGPELVIFAPSTVDWSR